MAAQNIGEVVDKIMLLPMNEFKERAQGEIKDFFAHEIMKFAHDFKKDQSLSKEEGEVCEMILYKFFDRVFGK